MQRNDTAAGAMMRAAVCLLSGGWVMSERRNEDMPVRIAHRLIGPVGSRGLPARDRVADVMYSL